MTKVTFQLDTIFQFLLKKTKNIAAPENTDKLPKCVYSF